MSALPQALPLAISASFYPPALLVLLLLLTGKHPRRLSRQTGNHGGQRRTERDRVHGALHPRAPGHPGARIERCDHLHSWDLRARARSHSASGRFRCGQGKRR